MQFSQLGGDNRPLAQQCHFIDETLKVQKLHNLPKITRTQISECKCKLMHKPPHQMISPTSPLLLFIYKTFFASIWRAELISEMCIFSFWVWKKTFSKRLLTMFPITQPLEKPTSCFEAAAASEQFTADRN